VNLKASHMLSAIFPRVSPYESLSRLRHAAAGTAGPHSARAIAIAKSRARKAGYTPAALLLEIGELPERR
jgi:hypothetical protein